MYSDGGGHDNVRPTRSGRRMMGLCHVDVNKEANESDAISRNRRRNHNNNEASQPTHHRKKRKKSRKRKRNKIASDDEEEHDPLKDRSHEPLKRKRMTPIMTSASSANINMRELSLEIDDDTEFNLANMSKEQIDYMVFKQQKMLEMLQKYQQGK
eukprot:112981_1